MAEVDILVSLGVNRCLASVSVRTVSSFSADLDNSTAMHGGRKPCTAPRSSMKRPSKKTGKVLIVIDGGSTRFEFCENADVNARIECLFGKRSSLEISDLEVLVVEATQFMSRVGQ